MEGRRSASDGVPRSSLRRRVDGFQGLELAVGIIDEAILDRDVSDAADMSVKPARVNEFELLRQRDALEGRLGDAFGNALGNSLVGMMQQSSAAGTAGIPIVDPLVNGSPAMSQVSDQAFNQAVAAFGDAGTGSAYPLIRNPQSFVPDPIVNGAMFADVSDAQGGKPVLKMNFAASTGTAGGDPRFVPSDVFKFTSRYMDAHPGATQEEIQQAYDAASAQAASSGYQSPRENSSSGLISIPLSATQGAIIQGVGNTAANLVLGAANMTVLPLADTLQAALGFVQTEVTGKATDFQPMSSYGEQVANQGAGIGAVLGSTALNIFNVSPAGIIFNAGRGGYEATTAIRNGNVAAATEATLNLGLDFAGAYGAKFNQYGARFVSVENSGIGPFARQRGAIGLQPFGPENAPQTTPPISKLEVVTFGESVNRGVPGDNLTGDHIPSIAAIRTKVENTLGVPLNRAQAAALRAATNTIVIDGDFHAGGRTYFDKNTPAQIAGDAQALEAAALKDQAVHTQNAEQFGYDKTDLKNAFDTLNQRNRPLFDQLSTQGGIKDFFTNLGVWEPE